MTSDHAISKLRGIASRRGPDVETLALARAHGRVLARSTPPERTAGTSSLPAGHVMTPLRVAFAAECGIAAVEVARRPTVAVFAISDAVEPGLPLVGDARHEGARDLLVGLLRADGLEPTVWPRLQADPRKVEVALRDAGCAFDAILVCGNADALAQARDVLDVFGTLESPGGTSGDAAHGDVVFGTLDQACLLAFPTEPTRLLGSYLTFGRCLLDGLEGRSEARPVWRGRMAAVASNDVQFQIVSLQREGDGLLRVFPLVQEASITGDLARNADGLLFLPAAGSPLGIDTPVDVIPLPGA